MYEKSMYMEFRELLAAKLHTDLENVYILSVMYNSIKGDYTDVRYAAHGSPWYQSGRVDGVVSANRDEVCLLLYKLAFCRKMMKLL